MNKTELRKLILEEISSILEESDDSSYLGTWKRMKGEFLSIFSKDKLISAIKKWCDRFDVNCDEYLAMVDDPDMIESARGISKTLSPVTEAFGVKKAVLYPFMALIIFSAIASDSAHAGSAGKSGDKVEMVEGEKEMSEAQAKKLFEKGGYVTKSQLAKISKNRVSYVLLLNHYAPEKCPLPEDEALTFENASQWMASIVEGYRDGTPVILALTAVSCPKIAEKFVNKETYNMVVSKMKEINPKFQSVLE